MTAFAQNWSITYTEALETAFKEDKPLILVFSGSDWCTPCMKLNRDIWQSPVFKKYADERYVLYKADFPRKKSNALSAERVTENKVLAEKYNPKGHFPLILVLDKQGRPLGKTGYQKLGPEQYISHLNTFLE